jgi:hypothetical protein
VDKSSQPRKEILREFQILVLESVFILLTQAGTLPSWSNRISLAPRRGERPHDAVERLHLLRRLRRAKGFRPFDVKLGHDLDGMTDRI